jgi:hypothetical protein
MVYPGFRIGVWTHEPAHRFTGESIIHFLSNEDTGKHRTSVRACFELAPGFFIFSALRRSSSLRLHTCRKGAPESGPCDRMAENKEAYIKRPGAEVTRGLHL